MYNQVMFNRGNRNNKKEKIQGQVLEVASHSKGVSFERKKSELPRSVSDYVDPTATRTHRSNHSNEHDVEHVG